MTGDRSQEQLAGVPKEPITDFKTGVNKNGEKWKLHDYKIYLESFLTEEERTRVSGLSGSVRAMATSDENGEQDVLFFAKGFPAATVRLWIFFEFAEGRVDFMRDLNRIGNGEDDKVGADIVENLSDKYEELVKLGTYKKE